MTRSDVIVIMRVFDYDLPSILELNQQLDDPFSQEEIEELWRVYREIAKTRMVN